MPFFIFFKYHYNSWRTIFNITQLAENRFCFCLIISFVTSKNDTYFLATNTYVTFKLILMCSASCVGKNNLNTSLKALFGCIITSRDILLPNLINMVLRKRLSNIEKWDLLLERGTLYQFNCE